MRKMLVSSLLLMLGACAAAHADTGSIKICRWPGIVQLHDHDTVTIPAGSGFVTAEDGGAHSLRVVITQTAHLPPAPGCATVHARVASNLTGRPVDAKQRPLTAAFNLEGMEFQARVLALFKPTPLRPSAAVDEGTRTYTNVDGQQIQSPTHTADNVAPAGATAQCADGSYSFSQHRRGTCSHHGGVAAWLN